MLVRDLACAAFGWALAAVVWLAAARLPRSLLSDEFGADGMPRGLALVLAIVSTFIAARALWARRVVRSEELGLPPTTHLRALGIAVLGALYVVAAPWIGYGLAVGLLIFATALYYGAAPRPILVAVSVGGALFLWLLFARVLGVSMPGAALFRLLG